MKTEKLTKAKLVAEMNALAAQYDSRPGNKTGRPSTEQQPTNTGTTTGGRIYPDSAFEDDSELYGHHLVD